MKFHIEAFHKTLFSDYKFVKIGPLTVTPDLKGVSEFLIYVPYLLINFDSIRFEISPCNVVLQFECSEKRNGKRYSIRFGGKSFYK